MDLHLNEPGSLAWLQFLQVTALIAVVGLLVSLVCRRRPHLAYVLWILVLLKCLTPPLWSSPAGIFSWAQALFAQPASLTGSPGSRTWAALPQEEITKPGENLLRLPRAGSRTGATQSLPDRGDIVSAHDNSASVIDRPGASRQFAVSWMAIFAAVWLAGALTLTAIVLRKWLAFSRILKRSAVPVDAAIESLSDQLAQRLGMRRKVPLRVTTESIGPAVFGLFRPVIVLPRVVVVGKTLPQIEPIIAH
jgi:beta-lactamase regulating signal transducer with metallopeptidase domain